ncbi:unnamed protein product [Lactuca saligna]|uniref:Terpene synthase N-terminal domain-containing protein n=1 Tax=Lactuca saligna TaxID=75948 RepID=A0AA36E5U6_LACSI|nr:unnamed protein product [Lactuca saligna]
MDSKGNFMESVRKDVQGMLSLYEVAYMRVEGEEVLDATLSFTTFQLKNIANDHMCDDVSLKIQIEQALEQPLRKRLPRLEAMRYIPIYQKEASHNEALLKFSMLDFNLRQSLHKKELSHISKYIVPKLHRYTSGVHENHISRTFGPSQKSKKVLELKGKAYHSYYTKEMVKEYTRNLIWQPGKRIHSESPNRIEMGKRGLHSYSRGTHVGYHGNMCLRHDIAKSYVHGDDLVTEDTFKWVATYPPLMTASCLILRLMDDIATHEVL